MLEVTQQEKWLESDYKFQQKDPRIYGSKPITIYLQSKFDIMT